MQFPIRSYSKYWPTKQARLFQQGWAFGLVFLALLGWAHPKEVRAETPSTRLAAFRFHSVCTSDEVWTFSPEFEKVVPSEFIKEFKSFLGKKTTVVRAFSEALALRSLAKTEDAKIFAEYWISRVLYQAGLTEIASVGFNSIIGRNITLPTWTIQIAAIGCMNEVHWEHRGLFFDEASINKLPIYFYQKVSSPEANAILEEAEAFTFLYFLEDNRNLVRARAAVKFFNPRSLFHTYSDALLDMRESNHGSAIRNLVELLRQPKLPRIIEQQKEHLKLMLGRIYYIENEFSKAITTFRSVNKNSNEFTSAIVGTSWSQFEMERYPDAIGIGIGSQSEWIKDTFLPETMMVAAMSLNEICRYPESVEMIKIIRKEYTTSMTWLNSFEDKYDHKGNHDVVLYPLVTATLKKENTVVPPRVVSEWVRSPLFLANQESLNMIFQQKRSMKDWTITAKKEKHSQVAHLLDEVRQLRAHYRSERIRKKMGEAWSQNLKDEFQVFGDDVRHYRRFNRAVSVWNSILDRSVDRVIGKQQGWILSIESELKNLNRKMLGDLRDIFADIELVEVEVLNGAGDDIIRQNAMAKRKKGGEAAPLDPERDAKFSDDVYHWGESLSSLSGSGELWEDEIDSLKAHLSNKCATHRNPAPGGDSK